MHRLVLCVLLTLGLCFNSSFKMDMHILDGFYDRCCSLDQLLHHDTPVIPGGVAVTGGGCPLKLDKLAQ